MSCYQDGSSESLSWSSLFFPSEKKATTPTDRVVPADAFSAQDVRAIVDAPAVVEAVEAVEVNSNKILKSKDANRASFFLQQT